MVIAAKVHLAEAGAAPGFTRYLYWREMSSGGNDRALGVTEESWIALEEFWLFLAKHIFSLIKRKEKLWKNNMYVEENQNFLMCLD